MTAGAFDSCELAVVVVALWRGTGNFGENSCHFRLSCCVGLVGVGRGDR